MQGKGPSLLCVCVCVFLVLSFSYSIMLMVLSVYFLCDSHPSPLILSFPEFQQLLPPTWMTAVASYRVLASVSLPFLILSPPPLPSPTFEDTAHSPWHGIQSSPQSAFTIPSHSELPLLRREQISSYSPNTSYTSHLRSLAHSVSYVGNTLCASVSSSEVEALSKIGGFWSVPWRPWVPGKFWRSG